MLKTKSQKTVTAGLFLALGVILPLVSAHGMGVPGTILLPMHLPVFLCGILAGPVYGGTLGLILPFINTLLTGMPVAYPMGVIMTFELLTYGVVSGLILNLPLLKKTVLRVYLSLVTAMLAGRVVYGLVAAILMAFNPKMQGISAVAATLTGLPGIAIQLVFVPAVVLAVRKALGLSSPDEAEGMINRDKYSCVVIKEGKIIHRENSRGIRCIMNLLENDKLQDTFVYDEIIGKAAAMIFIAGGVKSCYGKVMSQSAKALLEEKGVECKYKTLAENIVNRKGDGICPMEETVLNISDLQEGVEALKNKLEELSKS